MSLRFSLSLLLMVAMWQLVEQVEGRKKLCGDALNEALDLICVNGFSRKIKRSINSDRSPRTPEQALRHKWQLLALRQQLDQDTINEAGSDRELRRPRRRITHECCNKGCSYDDILEYCA
ncbi:GH16016 [Drosophila grimshawi]|uniref:GH16016 n=1 Tax=Drosophila grimshawi TaxID=7222 RepID=B4J2N5_DROGR|nr:GH16016 [Drosophila grimshawi]